MTDNVVLVDGGGDGVAGGADRALRGVMAQRAEVRRPGFVYAHTTRRVGARGLPVGGVEAGYVGRSRDVGRRTLQHAGLVPQRDGAVAEQPWWDLRDGPVRIVEQGRWTDAELEARERYWIALLLPRYNDRHCPRPDRIRKLEARRHRDARDGARGLPPRQWEPVPAGTPVPGRGRKARDVATGVLRSAWTWWLSGWVAATVVVWWVLSRLLGAAGLTMTVQGRAVVSCGLAAVVVGRWWWRMSGRRRLRRMRRRSGRAR